MDTTVEWKLRMAALRRFCGLPVRAGGEQGADEEDDDGGGGGEVGGGGGLAVSTSRGN